MSFLSLPIFSSHTQHFFIFYFVQCFPEIVFNKYQTSSISSFYPHMLHPLYAYVSHLPALNIFPFWFPSTSQISLSCSLHDFFGCLVLSPFKATADVTVMTHFRCPDKSAPQAHRLHCTCASPSLNHRRYDVIRRVQHTAVQPGAHLVLDADHSPQEVAGHLGGHQRGGSCSEPGAADGENASPGVQHRTPSSA